MPHFEFGSLFGTHDWSLCISLLVQFLSLLFLNNRVGDHIDSLGHSGSEKPEGIIFLFLVTSAQMLKYYLEIHFTSLDVYVWFLFEHHTQTSRILVHNDGITPSTTHKEYYLCPFLYLQITAKHQSSTTSRSAWYGQHSLSTFLILIIVFSSHSISKNPNSNIFISSICHWHTTVGKRWSGTSKSKSWIIIFPEQQQQHQGQRSSKTTTPVPRHIIVVVTC